MTKILVLSDPHYDFEPAKKTAFFTRQVPPFDILVVAGDVANSPGPAEQFFSLWDWFTGPKYAVEGNHEHWWGPKSFERNVGPYFHEVAGVHGFKTPDPAKPFEVLDDVLLFNTRYHPQLPLWDVAATNDHRFFPVKAFTEAVHGPRPAKPVRFSVSHLAPNMALPSRHKRRSLMFYNPSIDYVLGLHQSPVHLFGHTHETLDETVAGVRYVNNSVGYDTPDPKKTPLNSFAIEVL